MQIEDLSLSLAIGLDNYRLGRKTLISPFHYCNQLAEKLSHMIDEGVQDCMITLGRVLEENSDIPPVSHNDVRNGVKAHIEIMARASHPMQPEEICQLRDFCILLNKWFSAKDSAERKDERDRRREC
jgi:hypothetical protein